jgi:hypothetical protein
MTIQIGSPLYDFDVILRGERPACDDDGAWNM